MGVGTILILAVHQTLPSGKSGYTGLKWVHTLPSLIFRLSPMLLQVKMGGATEPSYYTHIYTQPCSNLLILRSQTLNTKSRRESGYARLPMSYLKLSNHLEQNTELVNGLEGG